MNEKIKAYYVADDIDEVLNYIDNLEQKNAQLKDIFEKAKKLIEVDTYIENIYFGFCYLFGNYDYEDLPTKIKDVLKKEN